MTDAAPIRPPVPCRACAGVWEHTSDCAQEAERWRTRVTKLRQMRVEIEHLTAELASAKADAWDEGYATGEDDHTFDVLGSSGDPDAHEYPHKNPYRNEATE
jgi:hypothetical protein